MGSQSTDLSSLIAKGVTLSESAKAYFIDTIDSLLFYLNDTSNLHCQNFFKKIASDIISMIMKV